MVEEVCPSKREPWWLIPVWAVNALLFVLLAPIALVLSIPISIYWSRKQQRAEEELQLRLVAAGRFLAWAEVVEKLTQGQGTLVFEYRLTKTPTRIWWTGDDLIAASPTPIPDDLDQYPTGEASQLLQEYTRQCAARYLNVETGTAMMTAIPADVWETKRGLGKKFPQAKMIVLASWEPFSWTVKGDPVWMFSERSTEEGVEAGRNSQG